MRFLLIAALALPLWPLGQEFGPARRSMEEGKPARAVELLEEISARKPDDPWALYNLAVASYAAQDFRRADELWQRLAAMKLPTALRERVWFQLGNASFRLALPLIAEKPDRAVARLEQSREAYGVAISQLSGHPTATRNLAVVEQRLEVLNVELAARLVAEARAESEPERAIEKLRAAQRYQQSATALRPDDPKHQEAKKEIEQLLAQNYVKIALRFEQQGDQKLAKQPDKPEERTAARGDYEQGLKSLQQALVAKADDLPAREGQRRLNEKLADLLAGNGRLAQRAGDRQARSKKVEAALEEYEEALGNFHEALGIQPKHADALAGRDEVVQAMEALHLAQGDRHLSLGEQQRKNAPGPASENLQAALDHFQQALGLNPANPSTQPRIDRVKALLPEVLTDFGKLDQQEAAEAEPRSIPDAIAYLERAESTYTRALGLAPDHAEALAGLEQVRKDLERLRRKLPPPPKDKQESPESRAQSAREKLTSILKELRSVQNEDEASLEGQKVRIIREGPGASYRDW